MTIPSFRQVGKAFVFFGLLLPAFCLQAEAIYTGYFNEGSGNSYWVYWSGEIVGGLYDGLAIENDTNQIAYVDAGTDEVWFDWPNPHNTEYGWQMVDLGYWILYCNGVPVQDSDGPIQSPPPPVPVENENLAEECTKEPINTRTGNNFFTERRLYFPLRTLPLTLDLHYQSLDSESGTLGRGWRHNYDWVLHIETNFINLYTGTGEKFVLNKTAPDYYTPENSINWILLFNLSAPTSEVYELRLPFGTSYWFSSEGRLSKISEWKGSSIQLYYGTNNCLSRATHSCGRSLNFNYAWNSSVGDWRLHDVVPTWCSWTFSYDNNGQFTQVVENVSGVGVFTTEYEYQDGYLVRRTDPAGHSYEYEYETGTNGLLNGKGTHLSIDDEGYAHTVSYLNSNVTDVAYSVRGLEQNFRYFRNANGKLNVRYGPYPSTLYGLYDYGTEFTYDTNQTDKIKQKLFNNFSSANWTEWMQYDSQHNITNYSVAYCSQSSVQQIAIEYDLNRNYPSAVTDAEGHRTELTYTNQVISSRISLSSNEMAETSYAYSSGLLMAVTNANQHHVLFSHVTQYPGFVKTTVTPQAGPVAVLEYDYSGFLTNSLLPGGRRTGFTVTPFGWIQRIDYADNLYETFQYDAVGNVTNHVDRSGREIKYTYAALGNLTSVSRQFGNTNATVSYDYDQQFNTLSIRDELNRPVEQYTLDLQDRPVIITNLEGQAMSVDYTVGDFVDSISRFDGTVVSNEYTTAGLIEAVHYPDETNQYTYLSNGLVRTLENSDGIISNNWNMASWLTQTVYSAASVTSTAGYAYDPVGNVTNSSVNLQSAIINHQYTYDEAERLTDIFTTEGTETQRFVYAYNTNNGLVASVSNAYIQAEYEYNVLDRITRIDWMNSGGTTVLSFDYQYNAVGMITNRVVQIGGSSSTSTAYEYDNLDRLVREDSSNSWAEYSYDLAGNRTSKVRSDNGSLITIDYALGDGNRLTSWTAGSTNSFAGLQSADIVYIEGSSSEPIGTDNRWGQLWVSNTVAVTPETDGTNFWIDSFDIDSEIRTVVAAIRAEAGNMGYATNQIFPSIITNGIYQCNAAGCVTNIAYTGTYESQAVSFEWDGQYQLTSVSSATSTVRYAYDVLSRRISRTRIAGVSPAEVEQYVYDGTQIVADLDASGNILRTYIWGPGIDNLLSMTVYTNGMTNTCYALKDHLNSIHAFVNESGQVVERYEYDAWGRTTAFNAAGDELSESAIGNRYCFQGREIDWTTGLYCFRARWYDPVVGRWLSKDPIGISGGLNQYVFCGNNPVNFTDPFGLYLTVSLYPGAGRFGHVGIGVNSPNTTGFYAAPGASTISIAAGQPVPGVMQPDTRVPITTVVIPTTPQQDQAVQNFINQRINNPGNYDVNDRNCATTVHDALGAGGVNTPETIFPKILINNLQQQFTPGRP